MTRCAIDIAPVRQLAGTPGEGGFERLLSRENDRECALNSTVIRPISELGELLGWLGLTARKPQSYGPRHRGVAFGSAASHPDSPLLFE